MTKDIHFRKYKSIVSFIVSIGTLSMTVWFTITNNGLVPATIFYITTLYFLNIFKSQIVFILSGKAKPNLNQKLIKCYQSLVDNSSDSKIRLHSEHIVKSLNKLNEKDFYYCYEYFQYILKISNEWHDKHYPNTLKNKKLINFKIKTMEAIKLLNKSI